MKNKIMVFDNTEKQLTKIIELLINGSFKVSNPNVISFKALELSFSQNFNKYAGIPELRNLDYIFLDNNITIKNNKNKIIFQIEINNNNRRLLIQELKEYINKTK